MRLFEPNAVEKIDINLQRPNRKKEKMQRVKRGMEIGRQRQLRAHTANAMHVHGSLLGTGAWRKRGGAAGSHGQTGGNLK